MTKPNNQPDQREKKYPDGQAAIKWIFNYWQTLKHQGMTEKQLTKKMNTYLNSLMTDIYPPFGLDHNVICPRCKYDQFYRPMSGEYKFRCAACGYLVGKKAPTLSGGGE